jgi:hypothetical protein
MKEKEKEEKPKVEILEAEHLPTCVSVRVRFNYGNESREMVFNFPPNVSIDEVRRNMRCAYDQYDPRRRLDLKTVPKTFDW